jgi:sigma-B regulation protein RsbU (phosphoserine phosphatase)
MVLRGEHVEVVTAPGTLVGVYPDLALTEIEIRLDPGDSLVLYTDGVTEGRSADGFYGADRLAVTVGRCAGATAGGIADALMADVCAFQHDRLHDDVAIFVMQAAA